MINSFLILTYYNHYWNIKKELNIHLQIIKHWEDISFPIMNLYIQSNINTI